MVGHRLSFLTTAKRACGGGYAVAVAGRSLVQVCGRVWEQFTLLVLYGGWRLSPWILVFAAIWSFGPGQWVCLAMRAFVGHCAVLARQWLGASGGVCHAGRLAGIVAENCRRGLRVVKAIRKVYVGPRGGQLGEGLPGRPAAPRAASDLI